MLQTAFAELRRLATEQPFLLVGTPGSVGTRNVKGREYFYRQFYDTQGKKAAQYVGVVGDRTAEDRATAIREQIEVSKGLIRQGRLLADQGYVRTDLRTGSILATLVNHGLFEAGATLVGSHAFGALLNMLGVASAAFQTEDVDIARGRRLEIALLDDRSFLDILRESTVPLNPIPALDRGGPSTSYKSPGLDRLRVDLLVPARGNKMGNKIETRAGPELRAHATALPYLGYLLEASVSAIVVARECVAPVKVPSPERFAWHKMLVSQLRESTSEKRSKDVWQATVLVAVLAEDAPDSLLQAAKALPRGMKGGTRRGAARVRALLEAGGYSRALEVLATAIDEQPGPGAGLRVELPDRQTGRDGQWILTGPKSHFDKGVVQTAAAAPVGRFLGGQRVDRPLLAGTVGQAAERHEGDARPHPIGHPAHRPNLAALAPHPHRISSHQAAQRRILGMDLDE